MPLDDQASDPLTPFFLQLATSLTARRRSLNLTQRDVARLSDVPQFRISEIETAQGSRPTIATLSKIAEALNLDLNLSLVPVESRP